MKKTTLGIFAILGLGTLLLTGCNKADKTPAEEENLAPEVNENTLSANAKTSLTLKDLENIDETNFPKSYTYSTYNMAENVMEDEGEYTYPEDISHTLLIPTHATMASREVISSGIEDGMIYTTVKITLQDGKEVNALYINNPETLDYVAANVTDETTSTNYQFAY